MIFVWKWRVDKVLNRRCKIILISFVRLIFVYKCLIRYGANKQTISASSSRLILENVSKLGNSWRKSIKLLRKFDDKFSFFGEIIFKWISVRWERENLIEINWNISREEETQSNVNFSCLSWSKCG